MRRGEEGKGREHSYVSLCIYAVTFVHHTQRRGALVFSVLVGKEMAFGNESSSTVNKNNNSSSFVSGMEGVCCDEGRVLWRVACPASLWVSSGKLHGKLRN